MDTEINPEIIYKAQLLRARIVEMPAHLSWSPRKAGAPPRRSSMRLARGILSALMSGFIFRPFMFFIIPGLMLLAVSSYTVIWIGVNVSRAYTTVIVTGSLLGRSVLRLRSGPCFGTDRTPFSSAASRSSSHCS